MRERIWIFLFVATVLLAVSHGAVSGLSKEASTAQCASNLKNLVSASTHYVADHNGNLPLAVDRTKKPWRWWYSELFPYITNMNAFYCPEKAPEFFGGTDFSPLLPVIWDYHFLSYGYNMEIDLVQRKGSPLSLSQFGTPARVLFAESNDYFVGTGAASWGSQVVPRHEGRAHFAFSDGHVVLDVPGAAPSAAGEGIHEISNWRLP